MTRYVDIGNAYFAFSFIASLGALWMMQKTTSDAGFRNGPAIVKLSHRAALATLSIVLMASSFDTLYRDTNPRPFDFMVQFALVMVIVLSALRHIAVPTQSGHNQGHATPRKS